jgi:predicted HAD superfamily Cof-like phosphohydrolase
MRALAMSIVLALMTAPASAVSSQVEAAIKVFQTVDSDANRMKTFCELMRIDEQHAQKPDPFLEAKIDKLLDELGVDFKAAWETAEDINPASDDGKALSAALDQLSDRCPHD